MQKAPAKSQTLISFLVGALATFARAEALTLHVPSEYSTIQAGIAASAPGDTVEIACATYYEHDIPLKPGITLKSENGSADCVIIDAQQLGRVFVGQLLPGTLHFNGLTILGGIADDGVKFDPGIFGGGIYLDDCNAFMTACVFEGNSASYRGGGIAAISSDLTLSDCLFTLNHAGGGPFTAPGGGGLYVINGSVDVVGCRFLNNTTGPGYSSGGAFYHTSSGSVEMHDCIVANNASARRAGGVALTLSALISNCVFQGNSAVAEDGGGLSAFGYRVTIIDCAFVANSAPAGGGVACRILTMDRCTIVNNGGGGIFFNALPLSQPQFISHVIVAKNTGPAISCAYPTEEFISCTDLYKNSGGDWTDCVADQADINGNFSADPLFCDVNNDDYTLQANSPCAPPQSGACEQIGAFGVGCEPIHVEAKSWGGIKALYR